MPNYSRFLGLSENIKVLGEDITIFPLSEEDSVLFTKLPTKQRYEAETEIIIRSLKDPSITMEDVAKWRLGIRQKFLEAILNVNGFGEELEELKDDTRKKLTG